MGKPITPSWVAYGESGTDISVGEKAKYQRNKMYDVKRIIGKKYKEVQDIKSRVYYSIIAGQNDEVLIEPFGDNSSAVPTKKPEEISSKILSECKLIAEKALGNASGKQEVKKAVVTVPAYFDTSQKNATADACKIAGLELLRLITEPTAAAVAYGYHRSIGPDDEPRNILVFDLGGGTYDVSCIVANHGMLDVQAVSGDARLGGRDWDEVLVDLLVEKLRDEHEEEIVQNDETMVALQILCERAKMDLS